MSKSENLRQLHPHDLKDPVVFVALGFGSGLSPIAPGTAGTLVAVPLVCLLQMQPVYVYALVTVAVLLSGSWVCGYAARKLGVHDHPGIVYDEIAGFLITMFMIPADVYLLIAGFLLFRFFDAVKPWPISWIDSNIHGGFGIMIDDVVAGLFSLLCLHILLFWWPIL